MKINLPYIVLFFISFFPLAAIEYKIQDLGTLTADESHPTRINNHNAIVGFILNDKNSYGFLWQSNNGLTFLDALCYKKESYNRHNITSPYLGPLINNHNQVVGIGWHQTKHWFKESTRSKRIYMYNNGAIQDLGIPQDWNIQEIEGWKTPSVWDDQAVKIVAFNDKQQILISNKADKDTQVALWENGKFQDIDPNQISDAYGMNNQGLILGRKWVKKANMTFPMLVLYNPEKNTSIEILNDLNLSRQQLNDRGQVIMSQYKKNPSRWEGFLWDPEKGLIHLEDFSPLAFNNRNQIIGVQSSELLNGSRFFLMWDAGIIKPIRSVASLDEIESLWNELLFLKQINDNGYIIAEGIFDEKLHSFVLIPQE